VQSSSTDDMRMWRVRLALAAAGSTGISLLCDIIIADVNTAPIE
jgi:hypothetical protein